MNRTFSTMRIQEMTEKLKTTIRLKKQESIDLSNLAFSLTKQAIMNGKQKVYSESDLVHFAIEKVADKICLDENGDLIYEPEKEGKKR